MSTTCTQDDPSDCSEELRWKKDGNNTWDECDGNVAVLEATQLATNTAVGKTVCVCLCVCVCVCGCVYVLWI